MTTKKVEYYVDLAPGWQDWSFDPHLATARNGLIPVILPPDNIRLKVVVELPCFGGTALASETVTAQVDVSSTNCGEFKAR
jgi:hypothetical protein